MPTANNRLGGQAIFYSAVLELCLKQIDECRPFFIGILGERYGWVPLKLS